jgi:uncharacterized protein (TIGR02266 family)
MAAEGPRKTRYRVDFEVVFDDGEGFMSGPLVDISETGCFIETVMPLDPGKRVRITPLVSAEAGIFELEGEVVRKNDYDLDEHWSRVPGMGVRFIDADPEQVRKLREFLERGGHDEKAHAPGKDGP